MTQLIHLKLETDEQQKSNLEATMREFNAMCNDIAPFAFEIGSGNIRKISDACYKAMRDKYGLPSQMTVRAIARAAGSMAEDKSRIPAFQPLDKVTFDSRILCFKNMDKASIMTREGRIAVPVTVLGYKIPDRDRPRGYTELIHDDGEFYLYTYVTAASSSL